MKAYGKSLQLPATSSVNYLYNPDAGSIILQLHSQFVHLSSRYGNECIKIHAYFYDMTPQQIDDELASVL